MVVERMQAGQIEETHYPRNPLDVLCQQIVAMCALDEWAVDDLAAVVRGRGALRRALRRGAGLRARPAGRPLPVGGVRRAAPADRVGPRRGHAPRPHRGPAARRHQLRHHPRPRPVHRHPPRRHPRRRARRGDGLREPAGGDVPARRVHVAHRGHHLPEGDRHPRARAAREDAVLARRRARAAARARAGPSARSPASCGPAPAQGIDPVAAAARRRASTSAPPPTSSPTSTSRPRPPAPCPTTARSSSSASGTRSATGASACSRPSAPRCTRPWAMALQHRLGERWGVPPELMWSDDGIVIRLPESVDELLDEELLIDPDEIEELIVSQLPGHGDVRLAVPGVRRPRPAAPEAPARPAHPAVAAAPALGRPALGGGQVPELPDPPRGHARVPQRRLRRARPHRGAARPAQPQGAARLRRQPAGLAVRAVADVRLDRRSTCTPATRPLAERRAAALAPRPRPPARPARRRGAARAHRRRRARRPRARAAADGGGPPRPGRRRAPRPDPDPRPAVDRRARAALGRRCAGEGLGRPARRGAARLPRVDRRRGAPVRGRGRRPAARTPSASRCRSGLPRSCTESVPGPGARPRRPLRPHPRPVPRAARRRSLRHGARTVVRRALEQLEATGGSSAASSAPTAWSGSGATTTSSASSAAVRWPRLRKEVEPVDAGTLARFLPALARHRHQPPGHRRARRGDRPAPGRARSSPRRSTATCSSPACPHHQPADLDALCTSGEVVWVGAGAIGSTDGRIRLAFRDQAGLLLPAAEGFEPDALHAALLEHLEGRGASFWTDLTRAAQQAGQPFDDPTVLARCGTSCGRASSPTTRWPRCAPSSAGSAAAPPAAQAGARRRPEPAASRVGWRGSGPPAGAGRWSLVAPLLWPVPTATEAAHARGAAAPGALRRAHPGGGAGRGSRGRLRRACTPCSRRWRSGARCAAGYFVAGLGAAQFAVAGAVDRLRAEREAPGRSADRAGGHRPGPALRRRHPVARVLGRPARGRRRPGRARRRRGARLPREGEPQGAAASRRRRTTTGGSARSPASSTPVASGRWSCG